DSLFMATSSVCVTGLTVINPAAKLSVFGKIVMAILMEIGGLSFITIAVCFFAIIGGKIGIGNRYLLKEALNQNSLAGIVHLVKRIILISMIIQCIGVILNYFALMSYYNYDFVKTLGASIFHSIASFNNAGFDVFGDQSLILFKDNILLNISTMFLILCGGLGFIVIEELVTKRNIKKLSIHSRIVLIMTSVLTILGMFLFKFSMYDEITWLQALFTSVTCRTAGFTTIPLEQLPPGAYITAIVLMFIGVSPCSTGGGVKTTTIFVIFLTLVYYARGKKPKIFHRRISDGSIFKAFALFGSTVMLNILGTLIIGLSQPELGLEAILFEVVSGFSTTGLSMGITASFNVLSKVVMCFLMFFGRLGPLTIISVVNHNWMTESKEKIQYVEERIIVG
ncbi:MAG TPA: potassium transporter TrkG, partial [Candidatus Pelethenecus sp.]|nr:potassium transporter TrkG [Candidatus Pelethenecus sp.]